MFNFANTSSDQMVAIQRNIQGIWSTIDMCPTDILMIRTRLSLLKSQTPDIQYRAINTSGTLVDFV